MTRFATHNDTWVVHYRFNEPLGPLSVLPTRRKQKVLVGSAFSPLFDHDKQLPRSKRKKRRPWL